MLESDNIRLGKILYALANSEIHPEFRISYTVKDPEAAKNEVLSKAVKDAKAKAVVLAEASGVSLKEMQTIDYSWGEFDLEVRPMQRDMVFESRLMVPEGCYEMDIEPDDIEVTDTVTVVWEIS